MKDEAALRATFAQFDESGQNSLDQTEFTGLIRDLGLRMSDAKAKKAFHSLNADAQGRIVFDEFSAWWFKYDRP